MRGHRWVRKPFVPVESRAGTQHAQPSTVLRCLGCRFRATVGHASRRPSSRDAPLHGVAEARVPVSRLCHRRHLVIPPQAASTPIPATTSILNIRALRARHVSLVPVSAVRGPISCRVSRSSEADRCYARVRIARLRQINCEPAHICREICAARPMGRSQPTWRQ